jgi:hypothetical protein
MDRSALAGTIDASPWKSRRTARTVRFLAGTSSVEEEDADEEVVEVEVEVEVAVEVEAAADGGGGGGVGDMSLRYAVVVGQRRMMQWML